MTGPELQAALDRLGWSQRELCKRLGDHRPIAESTVYRWLHSQARIPGSVGAYLELAEQAFELATLGSDLRVVGHHAGQVERLQAIRAQSEGVLQHINRRS